MTKTRFFVISLLITILALQPAISATKQINPAPNDDVIAGIKALHRSPEKEMARLKSLLGSNQPSAKRHEWLYLYALGKEKRGEYEEALTLVERCIDDANASALMQQRAKLLKAKILSNTGDIEEAIGILNSIKQWSMNHGVIQLNIGALMTLGAAFENIKEPKLALDNYLSAYDLATQFNTQVPPSHIAGLIGAIFLQQSRFAEAKSYLNEAYEFAVKKKNSVIQSHLAKKLARVESGLSNFTASMEFYDTAINIARKNNDSPLLASALIEKGKMLLVQENTVKTTNTVHLLFEEATSLAHNLESKSIYFDSLIALSRLALANGDKAQALEKVKLAERVIENAEVGFPHLEAAYLKLTILEASGDKQATIDGLKQYIVLNEAITESLDKSRIQILRTLYELDEVEAENSDLKAITMLQADKLALNQQRNVLLAVITGLFLILSALLFVLYVKRARYQKKLERLATTDGLTRFYNRSTILELLENSLDNLANTGEAFGVVMLDIDFFKSINDNYGHKTGDDALRLFAHTARQLFPKHVDMGRLGGEEFLFVLHGTNESQILEQLGSFRKVLRTASLEQLCEEIRLTFSAGLKMIKSPQSATAILEDTDKALYEAKETGRDQTVVIKCL